MEKRVILEKNGEYYRVIGAVYSNNEINYAHEIIESKSLELALHDFYQLNPEWTNLFVEDNTGRE